MIDRVATLILSLPVWVALLAVFAMPALESSAFVGFVFPGEIALVLGGVLASEGHVSLAAVLAVGIAGAVVGDSVGYLVGRRYGRRVLDGTLGRFVRREHLDRAERYLAARGGKAVFLGRFTAALRVLIPGLAGMSRMPYPRFAAWNVVGGVTWATFSVLLGYLGGSSWQHVAQFASRLGVAALVLVVLGFALGALVRRRHQGWARRLLESRAVRRARTRFPRATAWISHRLDPHLPSGLSLTLAVAVGAGATWLFAGVTQDVVAREELVTLDPRVHAWVLAHRTGWLDHTMAAATWLGSNALLVPLLALTGLALHRTRRSWRPLVSITVVYTVGLLLPSLVGHLVERPRPPATDWLAGASGWSFPSGHTLQATVAYGVLVLLLAPRRSPRVGAALVAAATAVTVLVATTRVYLGVHWFTDVLGSMSLGVALLCLWLVVRLTLPEQLRGGTVSKTSEHRRPDDRPCSTNHSVPKASANNGRGRPRIRSSTLGCP